MKTLRFYTKVNQLLDNGKLTTTDVKLALELRRYARSRNWFVTFKSKDGRYTLEMN